MDRTQKWMGSVGCLGQIENIKRQSLNIYTSEPDVGQCLSICVQQIMRALITKLTTTDMGGAKHIMHLAVFRDMIIIRSEIPSMLMV